MRSKMTPAQLAKAKGQVGKANDLTRLAIAANGHGVTSVEKRKAQAVLEGQLGKKGAAKAQEEALRRAGAGRRGLRDLFG